jgi:hypothetical protein
MVGGTGNKLVALLRHSRPYGDPAPPIHLAQISGEVWRLAPPPAAE